MFNLGAQFLIAGAVLSGAAAAAHLACIFIGPTAYRFMGAGEDMARAVEAGKLRPTSVTLLIASVLLLWSVYALSGAGVIGKLPLIKFVLILVCTVYIARAVAFPFLKPAFPENSNAFWWTSSCICGVIGILHAYGIYSLWDTL